MKLGLFGINMGPLAAPDAGLRVAQAAEAAGFESLWAGEHVVLPVPQQPPSPLPAEYPMLDPAISFAWLAAHTRHVRLGTGIIILPQRNPLVLAKELASLDVLSQGRLIFGVGIGYLKPEFDALGIPFKHKAERTLEYLEAMRTIWTDPEPAYTGRFTSFSNVRAEPRPVQQGGPPVVFGGHVPGAFERSVTHAQGWYGFGLTEDSTRDCLHGLQNAAQRCERPQALGTLEISVTPFGNVDLDLARRYADLGVDRLIVLFPNDNPKTLFSLSVKEAAITDYVKRLGDEVIARL